MPQSARARGARGQVWLSMRGQYSQGGGDGYRRRGGRGRGGRGGRGGGGGGGSRGGRGGRSGGGGGRGGRGGYNWRKHLPDGHPQKDPNRGVSAEEMEQYRQQRQAKHQAGDQRTMHAVQQHMQTARRKSNLSEEEIALMRRREEEVRRLKSSRDPHPQELFLSRTAGSRLDGALQHLQPFQPAAAPSEGSDALFAGDAPSAAAATAAPVPPTTAAGTASATAPGGAAARRVPPNSGAPSSAQEKMLQQRMRLPAWDKRDEIASCIMQHQVCVISGETGCGKTTQVPQFVLDSAFAEAGMNIVCTQPRRISAIGVAERVAAERCDRVGGEVGYQIRLERRSSHKTRLLFCTNGILLRRLQRQPDLPDVQLVILDEVHERNLDSDFLLICLRDLLSRRRDLRVVVMSATLNAELFRDYFKDHVDGPVPMLHIPGFTHPVEEFWLEDAVRTTGVVPAPPKRRRIAKPLAEEQKAFLSAQRHALAQQGLGDAAAAALTTDFDEESLPLDVICGLVQHICRSSADDGAVLIFLPGWGNIDDTLKALSKLPEAAGLLLLPLHGSLPTHQQRAVFARAPEGKRKVVASTNIAESSITIDDVVYVIDCGRAKEKTYDAESNTACLLSAFVSKASAHQRRGRAGRVRAGVCYHLYPRWRHEQLRDYALPEMLRTPLEQCCLQVRALGVASAGNGGIEQFLKKAPTSPEALSLANALVLLRSIGALRRSDEALTGLGEALAELPMDPRAGKALVFACLLRCLDPVLTITAALSCRSMFTLPPKHLQAAADRAKQQLAAGEPSDHLAMLTAFNRFREAKARGIGHARRFCDDHFLNFGALSMIEGVRSQFHEVLRENGLARGGDLDRHADNWSVVKACLAAGMYPNVLRVDAKKGGGRRGGGGPTFFSKDFGELSMHPASVNRRFEHWMHRWCVYNERVRTDGGLYVYDSTEVSPLPLLLFGGGRSRDERLLKIADPKAKAAPTEDERAEMEAAAGALRAEITAMEDGAQREERQMQLRLLEASMAEALMAKAGGLEGLDEASAFVVNLLEAHGGSYPMAQLSGFLKRSQPSVREGIGKIREWAKRHEHLVAIEKINGRWEVLLNEQGGGRDAPRGRGQPAEDMWGVSDWVYFKANDSLAGLVDGCRVAIAKVLTRRIKGGDDAGEAFEAEESFLDALAYAITECDGGEESAMRQERIAERRPR